MWFSSTRFRFVAFVISLLFTFGFELDAWSRLNSAFWDELAAEQTSHWEMVSSRRSPSSSQIKTRFFDPLRYPIRRVRILQWEIREPYLFVLDGPRYLDKRPPSFKNDPLYVSPIIDFGRILHGEYLIFWP